MKKILNSLARLCACFAVALVSQNCLFAQTAASYIASGTAALANETPADLQNADGDFANALGLEPANSTANFLRSVTRLALLQSGTGFQTLLTQLGVTTIDSNIYSFSYTYNRDVHGKPIPAANSSTDQMLSYIKTTLVPQVIQSEANLNNITDTAFSLQLSAAETSKLPVSIDYGDVQLTLSFLYFVEAFGDAANSYNLSVSLPAIYNLSATDTFDLQNVIATFPSLLTFSTSDQRSAALAALNNANLAFQTGSAFIRNTRTILTGSNHLFNIDANNGARELQFRTILSAAAQSISGTASITGAASYLGLSSDPILNLGIAGTSSVPPRNLLGSTYGNYFLQSSWPDPTLGGVVQSGSLQMLDGIASHFNVLYKYSTGSVDLGSGWKWNTWLGYYNDNTYPWIYHLQLGWIYISPASIPATNQWMWDLSSGMGWLWTNVDTYPYLYRASDGAWLWYEQGTTSPSWFYNFTAGKWESH